MSSFIIGEKTMHRCVAAVMEYVKTSHGAIRAPALASLARSGPNAIGGEFYRLNADAVSQRYEEPQEPPPYQYNAFIGTSAPDVWRFKALGCLSYQCAEGTVPNRPLFKELEIVENALACHIVRGMAAYTMAERDAA